MSYTLLLVDDEEEIRTSIAELVDFKAAGFELVGQASNGFEALELTEMQLARFALVFVFGCLGGVFSILRTERHRH